MFKAAARRRSVIGDFGLTLTKRCSTLLVVSSVLTLKTKPVCQGFKFSDIGVAGVKEEADGSQLPTNVQTCYQEIAALLQSRRLRPTLHWQRRGLQHLRLFTRSHRTSAQSQQNAPHDVFPVARVCVVAPRRWIIPPHSAPLLAQRWTCALKLAEYLGCECGLGFSSSRPALQRRAPK